MKITDLLTDESKWTKGACARGANGLVEPSISSKAVCWCLIGAVVKCYGGESVLTWTPAIYDRVTHIEQKIIAAIGTYHIADWQDAPERTFAEVRAVIVECDI